MTAAAFPKTPPFCRAFIMDVLASVEARAPPAQREEYKRWGRRQKSLRPKSAPHLRKVTMFPTSACELPTRQCRARDLREGTGLSPLICRRQRKRRARAARKYAFPSMPLLFLCTPPETRQDFSTAAKARKNRPTTQSADFAPPCGVSAPEPGKRGCVSAARSTAETARPTAA